MEHSGVKHAIIMAGGEGSRLRPITCTMPKPMVPLLNRPVLDYCIELLKAHGIYEISTTLFYRGDDIAEYIGNGERFGVSVNHSSVREPLGTAGSVRRAIGSLRRPHIIISGDALTDCNLTEAINFHKQRNAKVTIVLKRVQEPTEYGVALLDQSQRITRFLEKPVRSELFSDLANTGIYILEPEITDMIPENKVFDFSMDLFPMLLENDIPIHGYETHGYWCDIGDIRQYIQAQRDMLDGKVAFHTPAKREGGIFIEEGAHISSNAILRSPCYISAGSEIGERVCVDSYSVIGNGAKLHHDSSIKRSVIMQNANVRENVELRGAIVCPGALIKGGSSLFEDSVAGERCIIGESSIISNSASVWPEKEIDAHSKINQNVVWGIGKRITCRDDGISGYCDADISPETAVRIGAAFASILPVTSGIAVAGDGERVSCMLKRAVTAGIMSQGADVFSLPYMPYSLIQFAVRDMGLAGGVYISSDKQDPHTAHITLCDSTGAAIDTSKRRKMEQIFKKGEILPVTRCEIGVVEEVTGTVKAYEAAILRRMDTDTLSTNASTIILDIPRTMFDIVAPMLSRYGWRVCRTDSENGKQLYSSIVCERAAFGCVLGEAETGVMPVVMLPNGKSVFGMSLIATLASGLIMCGRANRFTMPVTLPDEYARFLMNKGASIDTVPEEWNRWQRAAIGNQAGFPELFDPVTAIVKLCELHSLGLLSNIVDELPKTYVNENSMPCTWTEVGRVLRTLVEEESRSGNVEPMDGVKIRTDRGWVIVKAGDGIASCRLICGSFREEYANELSDLYLSKLNAALQNKAKQ